MSAPVPANEAERLRTLRLYNILDTGSDKAFDDLARLAASICGTPLAAITLIDEKRQWIKSHHGFAMRETPRELAFCAHTIAGNDVMVVEDATKDERFSGNPMVSDAPDIRFYAGAPLVVGDGHALGALCVIDKKARHLDTQQLDALRVLRQAVVTQLELRRALEDFRAIERMLPMCAWCRSVREDNGSWRPLHAHVMDTQTVSHAMCPTCAKAMAEE